jgi:hypothetical protein
MKPITLAPIALAALLAGTAAAGEPADRIARKLEW